MKLPFKRTWWIEPGKVIGGRFPGTKDPSETRQMLADLLACGVRTIVNLQDVNERGQGGERFPDYCPTVAELAAQQSVEVVCHRFPIVDNDVPTPELMAKIQAVVRGAVEAGHLVYVHCWGGHGRTGTVAGCWMIEQGATAQKAFEAIKQKRAHDAYLAGYEAPQTSSQRAFVKAWQGAPPVRSAPSHPPTVGLAKQPAASASDAAAYCNRAVGSLLGLAVGDAVGTTLEFKSPGSFKPLTEMVGGGKFGLKPGEWTDDTSMALCLAESLAERGYFDPVDQLTRYVRWWKDGHHSVKGHCFDIGNQVNAALAEHVETGKPFCGPTGPQNAGNGSLMRLCPVAIAYAATPSAAVVYAGESSRTTHGNRECVDACRYFAGLLVGAIRGEAKEKVLGPGYCPVPDMWTVEPLSSTVAEIAAGSFKHKQPPAIKGTGYVVDCLEAALWAFHSTDSYEQAVLRAANLGEDADTTAAVCGQIAGAAYGMSGIPEKWLAKLAERELMESLADSLLGIRSHDMTRG